MGTVFQGMRWGTNIAFRAARHNLPGSTGLAFAPAQPHYTARETRCLQSTTTDRPATLATRHDREELILWSFRA